MLKEKCSFFLVPTKIEKNTQVLFKCKKNLKLLDIMWQCGV